MNERKEGSNPPETGEPGVKRENPVKRLLVEKENQTGWKNRQGRLPAQSGGLSCCVLGIDMAGAEWGAWNRLQDANSVVRNVEK